MANNTPDTEEESCSENRPSVIEFHEMKRKAAIELSRNIQDGMIDYLGADFISLAAFQYAATDRLVSIQFGIADDFRTASALGALDESFESLCDAVAFTQHHLRNDDRYTRSFTYKEESTEKVTKIMVASVSDAKHRLAEALTDAALITLGATDAKTAIGPDEDARAAALMEFFTEKVAEIEKEALRLGKALSGEEKSIER